jgi:hypothetical protein
MPLAAGRGRRLENGIGPADLENGIGAAGLEKNAHGKTR